MTFEEQKKDRNRDLWCASNFENKIREIWPKNDGSDINLIQPQNSQNNKIQYECVKLTGGLL